MNFDTHSSRKLMIDNWWFFIDQSLMKSHQISIPIKNWSLCIAKIWSLCIIGVANQFVNLFDLLNWFAEPIRQTGTGKSILAANYGYWLGYQAHNYSINWFGSTVGVVVFLKIIFPPAVGFVWKNDILKIRSIWTIFIILLCFLFVLCDRGKEGYKHI